ncbi:Para-hydroxybenzoate--polyprenyltransferase, mitochondrial precursor (PHB:polyprenyltransferase) [Gnomoniopsis sp. IMI 355080]|nr:Para-hydroxybenzoate--polyprenyltransferase, mitochondrial precursor (PHB:polyprenyltransferase) [Gnomoniopsis sp. IMI 355080]
MNEATIYTTPTNGFLSWLPESWIPYAELMRIHKPAGILYIYFPYLFGSLFAASIKHNSLSPVELIRLNMVLLGIAFIVRSIGCTWNDFVDREVDKHVNRSKVRPIARGAISASEGLIFMAAEYILLFSVAGTFLPDCLPYLVPVITSGTIYPYAKRFTYYAQAVLGLSLSMGIPFGCAAAGVDPIRLGLLRFSSQGLALLALAVSYILWTMVYDTIYAFQDIEGDKKMGNKAMSVLFEQKIKMVLYLLSTAQIGLLLFTGSFGKAGIAYHVGVAYTALLLVIMIQRVDLKSPEICGWWFSRGSLMVGGSLTASLLGEYVTRVWFF